MRILITGTSRGIGLRLATVYEHEHDVIGCGRSESGGGDYVQADITQPEGVQAVYEHIRDTYGQLDVLINNAGTAAMNHSLLLPPADLYRMLSLNIGATALMCQSMTRLLKDSPFPRIINFTSIAAPLHMEGEAVYAATKAAVENLTKTLAYELAPWEITVNAIGPPPMDVGLVQGVSGEKLARVVDRQAIKRRGKVEDIVNVIDWLIRPESNFVTGQIIYLGGI